MLSSEFNPTELWDQHVEHLKLIYSRMQRAALLDSVREKRASSRIRSLHLTSYIPKKDERQEYIVSIARTLDVSAGGAKIETHRQLDKGMQLELDIAIDDKIISAEGEVVYCEEIDDGLFGTGIAFVSIDEEDSRLLRL